MKHLGKIILIEIEIYDITKNILYIFSGIFDS